MTSRLNETETMWINKSNGETSLIQTIRPDFKPGVRMTNDIYTKISFYIFNQISGGVELTLAQLLEDITNYFSSLQEIDQIAYHVKLDLEARGYISLAPSIMIKNQKRLCVTSKGKKYFNEKQHQKNDKSLQDNAIRKTKDRR